MKSLDLLIVSRRFWPHSGLTELALVDLARNFQQAGHSVSIATFKWDRSWSDNISFPKIPIFRFTKPVSGPWTSFRYSRSLNRHFATNSYDAVIVSGLGDEALAATNSIDEMTPVILHVDDSFVGVDGKIHRRHLETCLAADAIIATSQTARDQLVDIEEMPEVKVVLPGLTTTNPCIGEKSQIREALSKVHPVVRVGQEQKLVICGTRTRSEDGLRRLVNAWPKVLKTFPTARLWLLGEGGSINRIWQRVVELELSYSILFPGFFDDLSEILLSADLYVHPGGPELGGECMLRAQAAGLACLAFKNSATSELIDHNRNGWLVSENSVAGLANSIVEALSHPAVCHSIGLTAREMLVDRYSPKVQVDKYIELIASCSNPVVEFAK